MLDRAFKREPRLPRFLSHMRQRLRTERLNMVVGAGISMEAGVPSWFGLLDRLSAFDPVVAEDIKKHRGAGLNPEYLGQIVFHRHRDRLPPEVSGELRQVTANHEWGAAVHRALYEDVPETIEQVLKIHPYLSSLRDLVRRIPLVINFNFDDLLSEAIGRQIADVPGGQALSVDWRPPLVSRRNVTTIYHVNGVLPRISLKKRSDQLIFTEDSFADAMARSPGVSAEYTFLRFVQNTMLILGHSLNDSSLKNYLRRNRDKSPANHHYMIHWIESDESMGESLRKDIFDANLELYNIITIFLTSKEINEMLKALSKEEREFCDWIDRISTDRRSRFHFYIAGPVAAGKSSLLEHLRCFETYEEWTRPPPAEMYLAFDKLDSDQAKRVDTFIYEELKEKNRRLEAAGVGFHFMDRAPLDLYAFSNSQDENKEKTRQLRDLVVRDRPLRGGEILFIYAPGDVLVARNYGRGRPPADAGAAAYFEKQTADLRAVYEPKWEMNTSKSSPGDIARAVARHALLEGFEPIDLNQIMVRYE